MQASAKPKRTQIVLWLVVTAVFVVVSLLQVNSFQLGVYQDDASYVVLARSLVSSPRYGMMSAPGAPTAALFPFGFPLLLAPLAYFFPLQPELMRWVSLAATVINGALLFWKWRAFSPSTSYWWGWSVSTLYLLSPQTVAHSTMVMSEAVFTSFVLGALVLFSQFNPDKIRWWQLVLGSVLLVFVLFTRTIGVVLVGLVFIHGFYTYRQRALVPLIALGVGIFVVTGLILAVTVVEPVDLLPGRYIEQLDHSQDTNPSLYFKPSPAYTVWTYLSRYLREIALPFGAGGTAANILARLGVSWLQPLVGLTVTLLIAVGAWLWHKKEGLRLPLLFSIVYLLTLFVWAWPIQRLLYPIQPQIFFTFLLALVTIAARITARIPLAPLVKYAAAACVLFVLVSMEIYVTSRAESSWSNMGDVSQRTAWLRVNAPPDAVVVTQYPQVDFIYGQRKTLQFGKDLTGFQNVYVILAPRIRWDPLNDERGAAFTQFMLAEMQVRVQANTARLVYQDPATAVVIYQLTP